LMLSLLLSLNVIFIIGFQTEAKLSYCTCILNSFYDSFIWGLNISEETFSRGYVNFEADTSHLHVCMCKLMHKLLPCNLNNLFLAYVVVDLVITTTCLFSHHGYNLQHSFPC